MAKTYFSQYIDDIDHIIKDYVSKHDLASIDIADARERNKKAQANRDYSRDKKAVEAAMLREAERTYKKSVEDIRVDMDSAIKALRASFAKHIAEYTAADPEKVDQSAVMLLNSGAMSDTDLVALANKYWNNPTMLKLIVGNAEKNLTDSKTARYLAQRIAQHIRPATWLGVFDAAADVAMRTVDERDGLSSAFQKYWANEAYGPLKAEMAKFDNFHVEVK